MFTKPSILRMAVCASPVPRISQPYARSARRSARMLANTIAPRPTSVPVHKYKQETRIRLLSPGVQSGKARWTSLLLCSTGDTLLAQHTGPKETLWVDQAHIALSATATLPAERLQRSSGHSLVQIKTHALHSRHPLTKFEHQCSVSILLCADFTFVQFKQLYRKLRSTGIFSFTVSS